MLIFYAKLQGQAEEAAIRETREEFGINIANIIPITTVSDIPAEYCPSQVFLCTEYYGNPICFNNEMENARFEDVRNIADMDLFLPFRLSLETFLGQLINLRDNEYNSDDWKTINGQHVNIGENGEILSGNPKVLGKESSSEKKNLKKQAKGSNLSNEVSAKGANEFKVKGFGTKQKLNNHWQNGRTHKDEYVKEGITTKEQYEARALELIQMPCGNGIDGYKTKNGKICRYDTQKNDYVTGRPDKGIYTMFKPSEGLEYFERMLKLEGDKDNG